MSSGRPARFIGDAATVLSTLTGEPRSIGVSTKPGGMLLTVMPLSANSSASDLVSVIRPPFDDEYCDMPFEPVCADDDEMLMTRPQPALSMSGIAACVRRNGLLKFMWYMRSIASCVASRNELTAVKNAIQAEQAREG